MTIYLSTPAKLVKLLIFIKELLCSADSQPVTQKKASFSYTILLLKDQNKAIVFMLHQCIR